MSTFEQPSQLSYQQLFPSHYLHESPWLSRLDGKIKRKQYGKEWNLARRGVKYTPWHPWYGPYQTAGTHLTQSHSLIAHLPSWSSGIKICRLFQRVRIKADSLLSELVFWIGKKTHKHCNFTQRKSCRLVLHVCSNTCLAYLGYVSSSQQQYSPTTSR